MGSWSWESSFWSAIAYELPGGAHRHARLRTSALSAATQAGDPLAGVSTRLLKAKFEREVDPEGKLSPQERAKWAEYARRAHMQRLALKSAKARRRC
jgi:hypothetical protein